MGHFLGHPVSFNCQDLLSAMKMLGLNPMEQDIMDLCNTVPKNGLIYFPDFCAIVLKRWREENEQLFRQNMFKVSKNSSNNNNMSLKKLTEWPSVILLKCKTVSYFFCPKNKLIIILSVTEKR